MVRLIDFYPTLVLKEPPPILGGWGWGRPAQTQTRKETPWCCVIPARPRVPLPECPQTSVCGLQKRRNSFNKATFKIEQVWSRKPQELPLFKGMGLLQWHWIIFSHSHSSPRTQFLFLDKPPFAACCEGNTQEELLAVTCFSKHWM